MRRQLRELALLLSIAFWPLSLGAEGWQVFVQAPPFTRLFTKDALILGKPEEGNYLLAFPVAPSLPLFLKAQGPFGGTILEKIQSFQKNPPVKLASGVIVNGDPNPPALDVLPALCPRLKAETTLDTNSPPRFVYDAASDPLNRVPIGQMGDPDAWKSSQGKTLSEMDGRNVLLLREVRVTYDYEDSNILDGEFFNSKTGKLDFIYEGMGGFYANFHYAIVPYAPEILQLPRQTLLHLAEGSLQAIGREELRPALRTHAFLPGPFLSKEKWNYSLCEWGDTDHQAPEQDLEYQGMGLWDWDYSVSEPGHVLMIVWENDEENELIRQGRIPPSYLTDDLVGIFEIRREDTLQPLTLKNARDDFEITVQTGNLKDPAPAAASLQKSPLQIL